MKMLPSINENSKSFDEKLNVHEIIDKIVGKANFAINYHQTCKERNLEKFT